MCIAFSMFAMHASFPVSDTTAQNIDRDGGVLGGHADMCLTSASRRRSSYIRRIDPTNLALELKDLMFNWSWSYKTLLLLGQTGRM